MVFCDKVHPWTDQHMIFYGYAAKVEKTAGMVDEYILPQTDMAPEIGMEWCKEDSAFVYLCADDIAQPVPYLIHIGGSVQFGDPFDGPANEFPRIKHLRMIGRYDTASQQG